MFDGFITVAALTPEIHVADTDFNTEQIITSLKDAASSGARIVVLPELGICGSTCGELFHSQTLLHASKLALRKIADETRDLNIVFAVGFPYAHGSSEYNCAALITKGEILGIVPKSTLKPDQRFFTSGDGVEFILNDADLSDKPLYFGQQIFTCNQYRDIALGIAIGDDYNQIYSSAEDTALSGGTIILNLDASYDIAGRNVEHNRMFEATSSRLQCAYLYANAGMGESTADNVFGGSNAIYELRDILSSSSAFTGKQSIAQINLAAIVQNRLKNGFTSYVTLESTPFDMDLNEEEITGFIDSYPFTSGVDESQAEYILNIQAHGLAKRMKHLNSEHLVLGISGGLDSTLALIVCVRACRILGLDPSAIHALSMPGLGTSERTFNNARVLAEGYGVRFDEISIVEACKQHFKDIGHDESSHDVVYENAQARERTQILMDIANAEHTFVVGTGDLSELVLGWATYNGDHMSMYGVNASIPKTLVRHLVMHEMNRVKDPKLKAALLDVCETPVSPELLPTNDKGEIAQITEDKIGPYVLHDFFIYQTLKVGMDPAQTFKLACKAFASEQGDEHIGREEILRWLKVYYQRLFSQQYKRSCMPDGPQATSVSVSPRGSFVFPTDAVCRIWLDQINAIQ